MKPLLLRKTWREIAEYLDDSPRPLKIVEAINRIPPRHWTFCFTFSRAGKTDLFINSNPSLSTDEMVSVLDGFLDEAFLADEVLIHGIPCTYSVKTGLVLLDPPHHNVLTFDTTPASSGLVGLQFLGFNLRQQLPSSLHCLQDVELFCSENTWLGSHRNIGRAHFALNWDLYGHMTTLLPVPRSRLLLGSNDVFTQDLVLLHPDGAHIGSAIAGTSPRLSATTVATHFGVIDTHLLPAESVLLTSTSAERWYVEIGSSRLTTGYWETPGRGRLIKHTVNAVERALSDLEAHDAYGHYKADMRRREKRSAARALANRQSRARRASSVEYHGRYLQTTPSCENEVVVLLSKLDVLQGIPFHQFQLVEYTARRGIDALANFQILPEDVPLTLGAVEIEFLFETFLCHRHPIEQVNMVICWDFKNGTTTDRRLSQRMPWLYMFLDGDYLFPVILLSRIPGLVVKEGAL